MKGVHVRAGSFWTAVGLLALTVAAELDTATIAGGIAIPVAIVFRIAAIALPLVPLIVGLRELALAARQQRAARAAEDLARTLRAKLGAEYAVIPRYRPRDDADEEVGLVLVGPPGVVVVEARGDRGEIVCYQDQWYRRANGRMRRIADSPSKRARWNATRVRNDVAIGGFVRTPVDPVVVFTRGHISEASSSSVAVLEGAAALLDHLERHAPRSEASAQRTRALIEALVGRPRVAPSAA